MAINRAIKAIIVLLLLVINISIYCYIPDPYIKCGYPKSVRINCLNVTPEIYDEYYEDITAERAQYVASTYAMKTLENHPRVEKVRRGADTAFSHKTWITVNGKEYRVFYVSSNEEYAEIESIIDEVAFELWRKIQKQISCVIATDALLILLLVAVSVKDVKSRHTRCLEKS